jgi:hypothetical protein
MLLLLLYDGSFTVLVVIYPIDCTGNAASVQVVHSPAAPTALAPALALALAEEETEAAARGRDTGPGPGPGTEEAAVEGAAVVAVLPTLGLWCEMLAAPHREAASAIDPRRQPHQQSVFRFKPPASMSAPQDQQSRDSSSGRGMASQWSRVSKLFGWQSAQAQAPAPAHHQSMPVEVSHFEGKNVHSAATVRVSAAAAGDTDAVHCSSVYPAPVTGEKKPM